jgi:hypothetical protein
MVTEPIEATIEKITKLIVNLNLIAAGGIAEDWVIPKEYEAYKAVVRSSADGAYVCITNHVSAANTEPGVGVNWQDFWYKFVHDGAAGETGCAANIPAGAFAVGDTGSKDIKSAGPQKLVDGELRGGFKYLVHNAGTKTSGTFAPDAIDGNMQEVINNGAFTLEPPATNTSVILLISNSTSAGAISTVGFDKTSGAFTTTNGHKFMCQLININGNSVCSIVGLQ